MNIRRMIGLLFTRDKIIDVIGVICFLAALAILIFIMSQPIRAEDARWICTPSGAGMKSQCHR